MEGWGISSDGWRKGPWTPQEDKLLVQYVSQNGEGRWSCVSKCTGLKRSGKSCRLRWVNYLRPGLKKGHLSPQEEGIIMELHALWGNRWSTIARYLPGRTDNEIKNYWRTHFRKRKASETKQKLQRHEEETDSKNTNESAQSAAEATSSPQDTDIGYPSSVENHGVNLPVAVSCQDNTALWSDFTPADCYLWGGIWNWDDQNGCSSRMVGQNQVDVAGYFGEGDAVDYAKNEGYILF